MDENVKLLNIDIRTVMFTWVFKKKINKKERCQLTCTFWFRQVKSTAVW